MKLNFWYCLYKLNTALFISFPFFVTSNIGAPFMKFLGNKVFDAKEKIEGKKAD